MEGVKMRSYPHSASAPTPLPQGRLAVTSAVSLSLWDFCPTVVLPLSFPFSWPNFFIFLFLLQSQPWSFLLALPALCPPLGPEPAAPWKGRALPGEDGSSRAIWGGLQESHRPVRHLFEQSCPGVKYPSAGTLDCISSPLWGLSNQRRTGYGPKLLCPACILSWLSCFSAGSFCSCPGISRVSDIRGSLSRATGEGGIWLWSTCGKIGSFSSKVEDPASLEAVQKSLELLRLQNSDYLTLGMNVGPPARHPCQALRGISSQ